MKIIKIAIAVVLLSAIAVTGIFVFPILSVYMAKRSLDPEIGKEIEGDAGGEFRGMYHIYAFKPSDEFNDKARDDATEEAAKHPEERLALVEINLVNYRTGDISDIGLSETASYLDTVIASGKGLIVRFVYDWSGKAEDKEPKDIKVMLRHIEQVAPLINDRKQDILVLQGSFAGAYGEMHSSKHSKDSSTKKLIKKLHKCIVSEVFLAVRTPRMYRMITGLAQKADLEDVYFGEGSLGDHISLYNDGMLGSKTDTGTYGSVKLKTSKDGNVAAARKDELAFQNVLCELVPNGGEVIKDNPYNDIPAAITDLGKMHVTYLNSEYDEAVLKKWKNTAYPEGGESYANAYEYITAHMGYRFIISKAKLLVEKYPKKNDILAITIENDGFAPYYRKTEMVLAITGDDAFYKEIRMNTDMTSMSGGSSRTYKFKLQKDEFDKGKYDIRLVIKDAVSGRNIPMANSGIDDLGYYGIGQMTVE